MCVFWRHLRFVFDSGSGAGDTNEILTKPSQQPASASRINRANRAGTPRPMWDWDTAQTQTEDV